MKEDNKKKLMYAVVILFARIIQALMILLSVAYAAYGWHVGMSNLEPLADRFEISSIMFENSIPLWIGFSIVVVINIELKNYHMKLTKGKTIEEYQQTVFDKTPPEIIIEAQKYETDQAQLKEYLESVQGKNGFTDEEIVALCEICYNRDKVMEEEREAKEKARKEAKWIWEGDEETSFSARIRKSMEEDKKK